MKTENHCFPTDLQAAWISAALSELSQADAAWAECAAILKKQPSRVKELSYVLPLLFPRLSHFGVSQKMHDQVRWAFVRELNQHGIKVNEFLPVLRHLSQNHMDVLLLKGIASACLKPDSAIIRPMGDIDFAVREENVQRVFELLISQNWIPIAEYFGKLSQMDWNRYRHFRHAVSFRNPECASQIDLHWHLHRSFPESYWDRDFWDHALPMTFENIPVFVLSPSDRLFHTILHGFEWKSPRDPRWVIDSLLTLRHADIDWDRVLALGDERHILPQLRCALLYLSKQFLISVPTGAVSFREKNYSSFIDRIESRMKCSPLNSQLLGNLPHVIFQGRRTHIIRITPRYKKWAAYLHYAREVVRYTWGVDKFWQFPVLILKKLLVTKRLVRNIRCVPSSLA